MFQAFLQFPLQNLLHWFRSLNILILTHPSSTSGFNQHSRTMVSFQTSKLNNSWTAISNSIRAGHNSSWLSSNWWYMEFLAARRTNHHLSMARIQHKLSLCGSEKQPIMVLYHIKKTIYSKLAKRPFFSQYDIVEKLTQRKHGTYIFNKIQRLHMLCKWFFYLPW